MSWVKNETKGQCENCKKEFLKKVANHKFCSKKCWYEFSKKNKLMQTTHDFVINKDKKFSDITITLIAEAILKEESIEQFIAINRWDQESFMQQMEKYSREIEKRKITILRKQEAICKIEN